MSSYFNALNNALDTLLNSSGYATFHGSAPEGTSLPYIVFSYSGGGHDNDTPRESVQAVLYIRAYARSAKQAGAIDAIIASLINSSIYVAGWKTFWAAREENISLPEEDKAGETIWACGAYYRIRMDK